MRYGLYFAPAPGTALHRLGSDWLGRDAVGGMVCRQPDVAGLDSGFTLAGLTAEPRRYGFHATLKAPFELADGVTEAELLAAVSAFAASVDAFPARMAVSRIGSFLALVPADETSSAAVATLAEAVLRDFDRLRAPLRAADIARRNPDRLPERQRSYLMRWGYPYVLDEFRFHMTLTGRLDDGSAAVLAPAASSFFAEVLTEPVTIDRLAVFRETENGADFHEVHAASFAI